MARPKPVCRFCKTPTLEVEPHTKALTCTSCGCVDFRRTRRASRAQKISRQN